MNWNVDADEVGIDLSLRAEGTKIAVFRSSAQVAEALRKASDAGLDLTGVRIVGDNLRTVTEILGRVTVSRHLLRSALGGVWYSVLFSLLAFIFYPQVQTVALVLIGFAGILAGLTLGMWTWFFGNGAKQFRSQKGLVPSSFTLVADGNISQLAGFFASAPGNLLRPEQVLSVPEGGLSAPAANVAVQPELPIQPVPAVAVERVAPEALEPPQYGVRLSQVPEVAAGDSVAPNLGVSESASSEVERPE